MKKYLLLTLLTTLATVSLSNPDDITYNEATFENKQQTDTNKNDTNGYRLMPFYFKLPNDDSKYNISFVGDQMVTEKLGTYTFKQKVVIPKGNNIVIFSSRRDSLQDAGDFANNAPTNTNNGTRIDADVTHDASYNNVPMFLYAYNKDTQKLEAIYFEDGTKAHYRNIITEDITKTTKEQKENADFAFNDGYVRADEIHLTGIGKIQNTTQGVESHLDKANHLVTGKTVYDYIQGLNLTAGNGTALTVNGEVANGDTNAVSGDKVFDYLANERTTGEVADGNDKFVTGDKVYDYLTTEKTNGDVADSNNHFVTGDKVYDYLTTEKTNGDVADANNHFVTGDKVYDYLTTEKTNGDVADANNHFVTGDKVYDYLTTEKTNGDVADANNNFVTGDKVFDYLTTEKANGNIVDGNDKFVTGDKVYDYIQSLNLNDKFDPTELNNKIAKLEETQKDILGGVASAVAMASIPLEYTKERPNSFAVGVGYYNRHSAVALGYGRKLLNDSLTIKVKSSFNTAGQFSAGAGFGFSW